jgi:hypothetical protein
MYAFEGCGRLAGIDGRREPITVIEHCQIIVASLKYTGIFRSASDFELLFDGDRPAWTREFLQIAVVFLCHLGSGWLCTKVQLVRIVWLPYSDHREFQRRPK